MLVSDRLVSESNDWRDVYNQISILPVQPFANKAHFEAMFDTKDRSRRQGQDAGYQLLACLLDGIVIPHWLWGPFVPLPPLNRKRINTGYDSELGDGVHGLTVDALQKGCLGPRLVSGVPLFRPGQRPHRLRLPSQVHRAGVHHVRRRRRRPRRCQPRHHAGGSSCRAKPSDWAT